MKLTLENFEDHIPEKILDRGFDYFEQGYADEFTYCRNHYVQAQICGTRPYGVELQIIKGAITDHKCDCPYDFGPYCKHKVALMYTLRDCWEEAEALQATQPTHSQAFQDVLPSVDEKSLRGFLLHEGRTNFDLRHHFLQQFGGLEEGANSEYRS